MMGETKENCPLCNYVLYRKNEGLVCRNHRCKLYFKLGKGWVLLKKTPEQEKNKFICGLMYSLSFADGKKRWMDIKKEVLFEQNHTCQFCKNETAITVHHIIPNHIEPIFTFDKDNLILACEDCHKKLHLNDKYKYS